MAVASGSRLASRQWHKAAAVWSPCSPSFLYLCCSIGQFSQDLFVLQCGCYSSCQVMPMMIMTSTTMRIIVIWARAILSTSVRVVVSINLTIRMILRMIMSNSCEHGVAYDAE